MTKNASKAVQPRGAARRITPKLLGEIEHIARIGATKEQIYLHCGFTRKQWYALFNTDVRIKESIERGRMKGFIEAGEELMKLVRKGDLKAIQFYLRVLHKWNDNSPVAISPKDGISFQEIPVSTGTKDPIEASKIYQKIMGS